MSDYHVRQSDEANNAITVIAHIPIPDTTNEVNVSYRTALVEWQGGAPIQSQLPGISQAEQDALDAGSLYEIVRKVSTAGPEETLVEKQNRFDALYNAAVTNTQSRLQTILAYWGYDRDVPE